MTTPDAHAEPAADRSHNRQTMKSGLSRRGLLAGLGVAAAGAALQGRLPKPSRALAQRMPSDPAVEPKPGTFAFQVGAIRCTVLHDGWFPFDPAHPTIGTNVAQEDVHAALRESFVPHDQVIGDVHGVLIQHAGKMTLIDTGCGALFGANAGKLVDRLSDIGLVAADVDTLVLTHLHPDHIGGLLREPNRNPLPNARVVMHEDEHAFWSGDAGEPDFSKSGVPEPMRASMVAGARTVLEMFKDQIDLTDLETTDLAAGLTLYHTPGHTPGHCGVQIRSGSAEANFVADVIHCAPVQFAHPDWHIAFDTDPVQAADVRQKVLATAADQRLLMFGSHMPFPGIGHVKRQGDGFAWVPAIWRNDLGGPRGAAYQAK
ncbi:MAG: MBL fold metallo-hydrolase [Planctomycetota bacterium]